MRRSLLITITILLGLGVISALAVQAQEVPRMTKEELKPLLGNPNVVVLDVRTPADYDSSIAKIKGAVRAEKKTSPVDALMGQYPKEKTLVFYCS